MSSNILANTNHSSNRDPRSLWEKSTLQATALKIPSVTIAAPRFVGSFGLATGHDQY